MSHFSVRLKYAGLAIAAAAAVVGGSAKQTDQPEEPVSQPQPVAQQVIQTSETPLQEVPLLERRKSECSAPKIDEQVSQVLTRLVKEVRPQLSAQEVSQLTDGPGGSLFVDAQAVNPQGPMAVLNVADTVCVIRSVDESNAVVWRVHFQGYPASTASR